VVAVAAGGVAGGVRRGAVEGVEEVGDPPRPSL
jgi:hypothetical protein